MADDKNIVRKKTKGKKFGTLAARLRYLYGAEAKTFSLNGMRDLKDGINWENRGCTDLVCLIIFIITMVCMVVGFFYAGIAGDHNLVLSGNDGAGNICGVNSGKPGGDFSDYPNVYFA